MKWGSCLLHGWAEEDGEDDEEDTREEVDEQDTEPVENPARGKDSIL